MSTKKMLNAVDTAVDEMLAGTVASNPGLAKMDNHRVVLRSGKKQLRRTNGSASTTIQGCQTVYLQTKDPYLDIF
jgi:hypothetical protein